VIWRIGALIAGAWLAGFALFWLTLGKPLDPATKTDGIVVLTGAPGRIDRGLVLLRGKSAKRMLVSGVDRDVRPHELAIQYHEPRLFGCCIDLGWQAVDTRSNAEETAEWVRDHKYKTVRLVTSDWHMPRARLELAHLLGPGIELVGDPVPSNPRFLTLFSEYHKYLVRSVALMLGAG
jgi:uncharacterized SAM-binding protein YcdF (DUF218 family)